MFPWFNLLVVGIIWKAFEDFWMEQIGDAEDAISKKLRELKAGEQLATSPLVKVLAVDNAADTLTILVRGPIKLSSAVTPFMRVEVVISRGEIHLTGDGPPIRVKEWRTVIGDLAINRDKGSGEKQLSSGSTKVVEGSLGFGYADGAWMGEGSLKVGVAPARLGAAIYGGISDRGMVLGLDAEFPAGGAIPSAPPAWAYAALAAISPTTLSPGSKRPACRSPPPPRSTTSPGRATGRASTVGRRGRLTKPPSASVCARSCARSLTRVSSSS